MSTSIFSLSWLFFLNEINYRIIDYIDVKREAPSHTNQNEKNVEGKEVFCYQTQQVIIDALVEKMKILSNSTVKEQMRMM